jgi:hypothetical protein
MQGTIVHTKFGFAVGCERVRCVNQVIDIGRLVDEIEKLFCVYKGSGYGPVD